MHKLNKFSAIVGSVILGFSLHANAVEAKVSGGYWHTLFIHSGNVYGMGQNADGELTASSSVEFLVPTFTGFTNAKSVAGTIYRTAVLSNDGMVTVSGRRSLSTRNLVKERYVLPATGVTDIAMSFTEMYYIVAGILYKWDYVSAPLAISTLSQGTVTAIAAGNSHAVALFGDGTVGVIGVNSMGQLGTGNTQNVTVLTKLALTGIKNIATGATRTFLTMTSGQILAAGGNAQGELGFDDKLNRSTFTPVPGLLNVAKIVGGSTGTMAIMTNGTVMVSGWHNYIVQNIYNVNTHFVELPGVTGIVDGAYPADFVIVDQATQGVMRGWGSNLNGKLGDGTNVERHNMTYAYFTPLPSSVVTPKPVDPVCEAAKFSNPFGKHDITTAIRCSFPIYDSMNACIKDNPNLKHVGQVCKNLIIPSDRGNGDKKKG